MIRGAIIFLAVTAIIAVALAMAGDPGRASLTWLGWRIDTSASAQVVLIGVLAHLAVTMWRILLWISEAPRR